MKPKEAARVFDRLDTRILMDLVAHMNPRKVSEILAVMEPSAAEKLTIALARQAQLGDAQLAETAQATEHRTRTSADAERTASLRSLADHFFVRHIPPSLALWPAAGKRNDLPGGEGGFPGGEEGDQFADFFRTTQPPGRHRIRNMAPAFGIIDEPRPRIIKLAVEVVWLHHIDLQAERRVSRASALAKAVVAARSVVGTAKPVSGRNSRAEVMKTKAPLPCAFMAGSKAWVSRIGNRTTAA